MAEPTAEATSEHPGATRRHGVPVTIWRITGEAAALDFRVDRGADLSVTMVITRPDGAARLEIPLTADQVGQAYRFLGQVLGRG